MSYETQTKKVLEYIKRHGSITPRDAIMDLGVMRLAARVSDLRKEGHPIVTQRESRSNGENRTVTYARYSLGG